MPGCNLYCAVKTVISCLRSTMEFESGWQRCSKSCNEEAGRDVEATGRRSPNLGAGELRWPICLSPAILCSIPMSI
jgi:hypothetical protein